jgi:hypothetical protein
VDAVSDKMPCRYDNLEAGVIKELYRSVFKALGGTINADSVKAVYRWHVIFGMKAFRSKGRKNSASGFIERPIDRRAFVSMVATSVTLFDARLQPTDSVRLVANASVIGSSTPAMPAILSGATIPEQGRCARPTRGPKPDTRFRLDSEAGHHLADDCSRTGKSHRALALC